MPSELREALESAVSQVENSSNTPATTPTSEAASPAQPAAGAQPVGETTEAVAAKSATAPPTAEKKPDHPEAKDEGKGAAKEIEPAPKPGQTGDESAPKAWKAGAKAKWSAVDPEIRQEIQRRESEMTRAFGENAQAREIHKEFQAVVTPFMARISSTGLKPLEAVGELLKADYILATAPTHQRATYMAKLIKDYGVDINALDAALAGEEPPDPVAARVEAMLSQKLQPIQQFLQTQSRQAEFQQTQLQQSAQTTVEQMAADTEKYPHFEQVRNEMADIIEFAAQRGNYITPAQAYERAVMLDPELQATEIARRAGQVQRTSAEASNAKAQKALQASQSVASSPAGSPAPGGTGTLRESLEAAFAQHEGR